MSNCETNYNYIWVQLNNTVWSNIYLSSLSKFIFQVGGILHWYHCRKGSLSWVPRRYSDWLWRHRELPDLGKYWQAGSDWQWLLGEKGMKVPAVQSVSQWDWGTALQLNSQDTLTSHLSRLNTKHHGESEGERRGEERCEDIWSVETERWDITSCSW